VKYVQRTLMGVGMILLSFTFSQVCSAQEPSPTPSIGASRIAAPTATFLVPKGIQIVVRITQSLNSYDARTGAKLRFEVAQDAIADGHVFAKTGDTAEGAVQEGQAGETGFYGIGYKAANLRFSVDNVFNFCGDTVHVDFDRSEYRRRQGFMGSNKDVTVVKGQEYVALTDRPQKVCAEVSSATPAPIPSGAIKTSDH
jgi:hypothetical protein